jgi:hypothetical protein
MAKRTHVRQIGLPRELEVACSGDGVPVSVAGRMVEHVRDEWRVDEAWWTGSGARRRYFDVVLEDGRNTVVFWDHRSRRWFGQRG